MVCLNAKNTKKGHYGLYKCECGNEFMARISEVKNGHTKSCGCYRKENTSKLSRTHGLKNHPLYLVWSNMIQRCYNHNNKFYKYYGGEGKVVCDEWKESFLAFYNWSISNGWRKGLFLNKDNNGPGYFPDKCNFVSRYESNQEQRLLINSNTSGYRGVRKMGNKWQARIGINGEKITIGQFITKEEAAMAYNDFVISRKSKHPLNIINEFKKAS